MPKKCTIMKFIGGFRVNGCSFHVGDRYEAIGAIGQGSYGVVCSAMDKVKNKKVAIKKIKPMAGDEWDATHTLREIRIMKAFKPHENVRRNVHAPSYFFWLKHNIY